MSYYQNTKRRNLMDEILAETMDVSMVEKQMDTKQNIEAGD